MRKPRSKEEHCVMCGRIYGVEPQIPPPQVKEEPKLTVPQNVTTVTETTQSVSNGNQTDSNLNRGSVAAGQSVVTCNLENHLQPLLNYFNEATPKISQYRVDDPAIEQLCKNLKEVLQVIKEARSL